MKGLLDGLKSLGIGRLVAMGAVGVGVLALLTLLALRGGTERFALLYSDLDVREANQISEALDHQHIAHQVGSQGTEILVPDTMVGRARLLLARDGLPSGGAIGYEIFDRGDGLVASQFQQTINQTRALEGELARTIRGIHGVRGVRVHLVLPRREAFASSHTDAQASVMLTMAGTNRVDHEGVQAIVTLVAAAVPGLRPDNVAIIDSLGTLLARAGAQSGADASAAALADLGRATELRLSRAVEEMLEPSLGIGHVRAEASVDMDIDQVRETQEKFDPDGQVARGTQNVTSSSRNTDPGTPTTVQNNLPNSEAGANGAASQEQKQEETTNYEIGKTVRTIVRDHPQIRKISIAVMVDGTEARDDKGVAQWHPRPPEEIEHIVTLVKSAIGFDAKRGDRVDVVTMQFHTDAPAEASGSDWPAHFDKADLLRLGETGLLGLMGVVALLFVLRPMVMRITALAGEGTAPALDVAITGGLVGQEAGQLLLPNATAGQVQGGNAVALAGNGGEAGDDAAKLITIGNVEGQMRASSIRRIAELVEKHPEESLAIVRAWMHQEAA